jgi:hypothetical protein
VQGVPADGFVHPLVFEMAGVGLCREVMNVPPPLLVDASPLKGVPQYYYSVDLSRRKHIIRGTFDDRHFSSLTHTINGAQDLGLMLSRGGNHLPSLAAGLRRGAHGKNVSSELGGGPANIRGKRDVRISGIRKRTMRE